MAKQQNQFAISASRTDDGAPVYRTGSGGWHRSLGEAAIFETADAADAELTTARGEERQVCDPYLVKVQVVDGATTPVSKREHIRATGPTSRLRRPDPQMSA